MTDFVNNWNNELLTTPVAPLGLIAMPGCEEMGKLVNGMSSRKLWRTRPFTP